MAKCKSKTASGQPCQAQAITGSDFCFTHDPASAAARQAARKQGGLRNRVGHSDGANLPAQVKTIDDVLKILDYALQEALPLENSVQRGRLLVSIAGAFTEAIRAGELENRLAALEAALKMREAK